MKSILLKSLVALFLIIYFGCQNTININSPENRIHGSGKIVSETRIVDDCSGIVVQNIGKVYVRQSDEQFVRIEADDNLIDLALTYKEGNSLVVGVPEGSYSDITLKFYLSLKSLEKISILGAGDVHCAQSINAPNLFCTIDGTGSIYLSGNGDYLNCFINGAGNIHAREFTAAECSSVVNGAGKCILFVTDNLDAAVNGVGSIIYYGNPANVKSSVSGIGEIKAGL